LQHPLPDGPYAPRREGVLAGCVFPVGTTGWHRPSRPRVPDASAATFNEDNPPHDKQLSRFVLRWQMGYRWSLPGRFKVRPCGFTHFAKRHPGVAELSPDAHVRPGTGRRCRSRRRTTKKLRRLPFFPQHFGSGRHHRVWQIAESPDSAVTSSAPARCRRVPATADRALVPVATIEVNKLYTPYSDFG
jgi:hypothetical protein